MKKLLCLLLAGMMLVSTVACSTTSEDDVKDDNKGTETEATAETEDPAYSYELSGALNYSGETVNFLYPKSSNFQSEIYAEKLGNGVVPDAVYERNVAVEDKLKLKLAYHETDDVMEDLNRDIQSGLGDFDLINNPTYITVPAVVEGKLLNLNALDNIMLDKAYWSAGFNEMMTFTEDELQFLASGSIAISMYRFMYMTLYNKQLFRDNKLPDLYDIVMEGQWTLDKQYSLSKDHYVDADGDGAVSDGDFYGFVTGNCISVDPYMVATDTALVIRDAETGDLVYNPVAGAKLVDVCDKIQLLYNDASTFYYEGADGDNTNTTNIINHFTDEKALMVTSLFVQMETNYADLAPLTYGIAPIPKFNASQSGYRSYVQDQVTCFGISAVVGEVGRQEMCAATLEAMAYFSNKLVRPAYYDTALSERYMQDPQSKEILDLIFDSLCFDFSSTCCNMMTVMTRDQLRTLLTGETNTIASSTKTWEKSIKNSMNSINRKLSKVAQNQMPS